MSKGDEMELKKFNEQLKQIYQKIEAIEWYNVEYPHCKGSGKITTPYNYYYNSVTWSKD